MNPNCGSHDRPLSLSLKCQRIRLSGLWRLGNQKELWLEEARASNCTPTLNLN